MIVVKSLLKYNRTFLKGCNLYTWKSSCMKSICSFSINNSSTYYSCEVLSFYCGHQCRTSLYWVKKTFNICIYACAEWFHYICNTRWKFQTKRNCSIYHCVFLYNQLVSTDTVCPSTDDHTVYWEYVYVSYFMCNGCLHLIQYFYIVCKLYING